MVKQLLKLDGTPQPDAADAIAVALTHAHHSFAKQPVPFLKNMQIKRGRFV
jgi:crossover junction endodeoxyribonuclease RuvC